MKRTRESGFTLIELLVVVAIIGILAAIAIPQFQSYRQRSFDAAAISDLKNIMTAQEVEYSDNSEYLDCDDDDCNALPGFKLSQGVSVSCSAAGGEGRYSCTLFHPSGGKSFTYSSDTGLFQEEARGGGGGDGGIL